MEIMETKKFFFLLGIFLSLVETKASAYDIAVENADGVTIYYNYINDGKELELTYEKKTVPKGGGEISISGYGGIKKLNIPSEVTYLNRTRKVTKIGENVFYRCYDLEEITIPPTITVIDEFAFYWNSSLKKVIISDIAAWCNCDSWRSNPLSYDNADLYSDENTLVTDLIIPEGVEETKWRCFENCKKIETVTFPNSLKKIGKASFMSSGLKYLNIPNNVTIIEGSAFQYCKQLSSVTLSNCTKIIESCAFANCSELVSISIPNTVETIGSWAFGDCDKIEKVYSCIEEPFEIPNGNYTDLKPFGKNTYYNATLYVPKGTIEKYKAIGGWKDFLYIEEGSPSSITKIESDEASELKRYTLDGKVAKYPHKGINIIQMNNGSSKKVVVW